MRKEIFRVGEEAGVMTSRVLTLWRVRWKIKIKSKGFIKYLINTVLGICKRRYVDFAVRFDGWRGGRTFFNTKVKNNVTIFETWQNKFRCERFFFVWSTFRYVGLLEILRNKWKDFMSDVTFSGGWFCPKYFDFQTSWKSKYKDFNIRYFRWKRLSGSIDIEVNFSRIVKK